MKKILLDTDAYSSLLSGDSNVLDILSKANIVYMSIFVIAELYTGFKGGRKEKENKTLLQTFLDKPTVNIMEASLSTSEIFSEIKHALKASGKPLPINDIWIASHARETGAVLVTYDKHYKSIPGLRLWDHISSST